MRVLLKTCVIATSAIILVGVVGLAWLFFYSRGLPDALALAQFAPAAARHLSDPCLKAASVVIPYDSIGDNMRAALNAAEVEEDGPGVLAETYRRLRGRPSRGAVSWQISRTMFCNPAKTLRRQLDELRAAAQLERCFSRRELFTILANRAMFGEDIVGVEPASQHFFHKEPNQLAIGEAALLAGLVKAPSYLSPIKHPDRALLRRNKVIDKMLEARAISESMASTVKASPLSIITK